MEHIAIFGGTFDPVHNGHIQTSLKIQAHFNFDHYYFLPCKIPVLKPNARASNDERIEMLRLALKPYPQFSIDLREIERDTPSYTVHTLESFRAEYPKASITLIMGYDSFLSLPQWYQWEKIPKLANILVISRLKYHQKILPKELEQLIQKNDHKEPLNSSSGAILLFNAGDYDISSSRIREEFKKESVLKNQLPEEVYDYIKALKLYQG